MTDAAVLVIALAAALVAALLLRAVWEPTRLVVTRVRLPGCQPCREPVSGSPPSDLRILFFSDLHMDHLLVPEQRLMAAVQDLEPDLILFGGDLASRESAVPDALSLLARLRGQPSLTGVPMLAVPGNHDTPDTLQQLSCEGIQVLQNKGYHLRCRGLDWLIIGLDDRKRGEPDPAKALQEAEDAVIPPERRLVLVHNPDSLLVVPPGQAAWFCAGHFHGGQIWMPFRLEFRILRDEKLPRIGYDKGCINLGEMTGVITQGLGCVLFPLRFRSRPELNWLEIILPDKRQNRTDTIGRRFHL